MLSADKRKSVADIHRYLSGRQAVLSWKLDGLKMLNRALIYTAETRAKKQVIIVGDWEAVVRAIQTADTKRRNTMLAVRINDLTKE